VRGRTARILTHRYVPDVALRRSPDEVIVEEPMSIHLDGTLVATTMRTPGDDFELAVGYCHTEGLLVGAPVQRCRYCGTGSAVESGFNAVTVETGGRAPIPTPRLTPITSSCGICGSRSLDDLQARLDPLVDLVSFPPEVLARAVEKVTVGQPLFAATGGVHAAAAFGVEGSPLMVREDIGRHNAVDKVVGRLLLDGALPAHGFGLFVSGRASFEIVQKAWAAGFAALVAVSAPSSLAVEAARAAGLTLAGFVRDGRLNVYAPAMFDS
jgi:FdhD protein